MGVSELSGRVVAHTVVASAVLAVLVLPFNAPAALGMMAAGALSALNFRGLTRGALWAMGGARPSWLWGLASGARLLLLMAALALLFVSGAVHPVAVVAGLGVLPAVLVVGGLRGARTAMGTR
jgi:hypothetical protein